MFSAVRIRWRDALLTDTLRLAIPGLAIPRWPLRRRGVYHARGVLLYQLRCDRTVVRHGAALDDNVSSHGRAVGRRPAGTPGVTYYIKSGTNCVAEINPSIMIIPTSGAEISPSSFAPMTSTTTTATL